MLVKNVTPGDIVITFLHECLSSPVLMCPGPYVLHSSKAARDPRVSVQLLDYRLAHFQVIRVTCGLRVRIKKKK